MKDTERYMFGNVGQNDKYLITKLKSYNITLDKIDCYLIKLRQDTSLEQSRNLATLS